MNDKKEPRMDNVPTVKEILTVASTSESLSEIVIYQIEDRHTEVEVRFESDTVWLNQEQLCLLFQRDQSVISRHILKIGKEGELDLESNMQKMHIANSDKPVMYYNLDLIISIGYRVNSKRGIQFRQWATKRLKDYLVDGYAINQKRLEERNLEIKHLKEGISILHRAIEHQAKTIAVSRPDEMETVKKVIISILNRRIST